MLDVGPPAGSCRLHTTADCVPTQGGSKERLAIYWALTSVDKQFLARKPMCPYLQYAMSPGMAP